MVRRSPRIPSSPRQRELELAADEAMVEWRILRDGLAMYIAKASEPEELESATFHSFWCKLSDATIRSVGSEKERLAICSQSIKVKKSKKKGGS